MIEELQEELRIADIEKNQLVTENEFLKIELQRLKDRSSGLVLIESPYAGDVKRNIAYARACMRDCFMRGEMPYASHLLYTQEGVLDDSEQIERMMGINAGLLWGSFASKTVVYEDLGISTGMRYGIARAIKESRPVEYRELMNWSKK